MAAPKKDQPVKILYNHALALAQVPVATARADNADFRAYADSSRTQAFDIWNNPDTLGTTAHEVWAKMDLTSGEYHPGVAAYWPLDADGDDIVGGLTGTVGGSVTLGGAGQVGTSALFGGGTGVSNRVAFPSTLASGMNGQSVCTLEFWINSLASADGVCFDITVDGGQAKFFTQMLAAGTMRFGGRSQASDSFQEATGATAVNDGVWHHCVFEIDVGNDLLNSWIDDTPDVVNAARAFSLTAFNAAVGTNHAIGSATVLAALDGRLDNVAFYYGSLTDAQRRSSYLRGLQGKPLAEPAPTAAWDMEQRAGTTVIDVEGGHNGTIVGGVTTGVAGRVGESFTFNGTTGYVQIPDDPGFESHIGPTGTMTLAATVVWDGSQTSAILAKDDDQAFSDREFEWFIDANGLPSLFVDSGVATDRMTVSSNVPIPANVPVHVAVTYDASIGPQINKIVHSIDGVEVPRAITFTDGTFVSMNTSGTQDVLIGAVDDAVPVLFFSGDIAEVFWTSDLLPASTIADLAERSRQGLRPDLDSLANVVGYWSMDDRDLGLDPLDIIGSNNGTANGTVTVVDGPVTGTRAVDLGSAAQDFYISVPDDPVFDAHLGAAGVMSIAGWVRTRTPTSGSQIFAARYDDTGSQEFEWQFRVSPDGELAFGYFQQSTAAGRVVDADDLILPTNDWAFAVATFDNSVGTDLGRVELYLDGVQSTSKNLRFTAGSFSLIEGVAIPMTMGRLQNAGSPGSFLDGQLGKMMYFPQVLTPAEVLELYRKESNARDYTTSNNPLFVDRGLLTRTSVDSAVNVFGAAPITTAVAAWDFDEPDGGQANDLVSGNHLTPVGDVGVSVETFGLGRNTTNGILEAGASIVAAGDYAVLFAVRTTASDMVLASNYDGVNTTPGFAFEVAGGKFQVRHSRGIGGGGETTITSTTDVDDGVLHHCLAVIDDGNLISVYVDGNTAEDTQAVAATIAPAENLRFGSYVERNFVAPAGLVLRLEADNIDPDTDVDLNGLVTDWADLSASGNNASQGTAASRPVYVPEGIGGLPAVMVGADEFMGLDSSIDLSSDDFTLFLVLRPNETFDSSISLRFVFTEDPFVDPGMNLGFGNVTTGLSGETFGWVGTSAFRGFGDTTGTSFASGQPFLLRAGLNGTTSDIAYGGGSAVTVTTFGTVDSGSSGSLGPFDHILGRSTSPGNSLNAQISAIMLFDNRLSGADTDTVERYLALKYGLPYAGLPASMPTRAPAVFDTARVISGIPSSAEIARLTDTANYPMISGTDVITRPRDAGAEPISILLP